MPSVFRHQASLDEADGHGQIGADGGLSLTGGQPFIIQPDGTNIKTTEMLALNIYNTFYSSNSASKGVAQSKAVIFFILVATLGLIQLAYTRKREVQQ